MALLSSIVLDSTFVQVLRGLNDDEVGQLCCNSETIMLMGQRLWDKDKSKVDKTQEVLKAVKTSMRELGSLYIEFRKNTESFEVVDMFNRVHFSALREAIFQISVKESDGIDHV